MKNQWQTTFTTICLACLATGAAQPKGKVKIFMLAGQSNMEGKAGLRRTDRTVTATRRRGIACPETPAASTR